MPKTKKKIIKRARGDTGDVHHMRICGNNCTLIDDVKDILQSTMSTANVSSLSVEKRLRIRVFFSISTPSTETKGTLIRVH
jgi:hypothetical protein